jgi:hypothetical protein
MAAEQDVLNRMLSAKKLTSQQALVIVNTRTRTSIAQRCAMGSGDFQTEGAESFYGTIYDDGNVCLVVNDRSLITIIVPDRDQRQAIEEIMERASEPKLTLIRNAPDPAPFELCLLQRPDADRGDLPCTPEQLDWWLSRFFRVRKPSEVQILVSEGLLSRNIQTVRTVVNRLDGRAGVIQFLSKEMQEATEESFTIWHGMLQESAKAFRNTVVICSKPEELLLGLTCLLVRATELTEDEKLLPPGLVYAVDSELHSRQKLSSFRMPI